MRNNNLLTLFVFLLTLISLEVSSDPFPPYWNNSAGAAIHFPPVAWPNEPADPADCQSNCGDWVPYSRFENTMADPRIQDPSNGGTAPQNYVNIASSCIDKNLPSIYYNLAQHPTDPAQDVLMFRWRVEQQAHTYATGPSPGNFGASDPWNSALWTVLFDTNGDGVRDLAAHLDGSSGAPGQQVDRIFGIWGNIPTQSINYLDDPNIHVLGHSPTGFIGPGNALLNFQNDFPASSPTETWPDGRSTSSWDYGTTRAKLVSKASCNEYFIDYQIPVSMLDATGIDPNGPKITRDTPLAMLFCTANSLNNPFQKDCAINRSWVADESKAAPFGDYLSFDKGLIQQPIVSSVTANDSGICSIYDLKAQVQDAIGIINNEAVTSIKSVTFHYYYDTNGNGAADDGNSWMPAATGTLTPGSLNEWTATWDARSAFKGQYLIGAQAVDDNTVLDDDMTPSGIDNRTFSYIDGDAQDQIYVDGVSYVSLPPHAPIMTPSAAENWFSNPDIVGIQAAAVGLAINQCGVAPVLTKTADNQHVTVGQTVTFTLTVDNTSNTNPITLAQLEDNFPAGFSYLGVSGGTLQGEIQSTTTAGNTITWIFNNHLVAGGGTATLEFQASAPTDAGIYNNNATTETSFGVLPSNPLSIEVGAPRLNLSKVPDRFSASPGDTLMYSLNYSNDSPVTVHNAILTDILPAGVTLDTNPDSGVYDSGARTLTWAIGSLAAGSGYQSVSYSVIINNPYDGLVPLVNTATLDSDQTVPIQGNASVFINAPVPNLVLEKAASKSLVDPASAAPSNQVTFTLNYANNGTGDASNVQIIDTIPAGFTYVSALPVPGAAPAAGGSGTVTWNIGAVAASASGSVTLTLQVDDPFNEDTPVTNTATIQSDQTLSVNASSSVGVVKNAPICTTNYFKNSTTGVGFDGDQLTAKTQLPTSGTPASLVFNATTVAAEAIRFYLDPATTNEVAFDGTVTTTFYVDKDNGPRLELDAYLYDYNPATGLTVQLGTESFTETGGGQNIELQFTIPVTGTLKKGHRLLWVFDAYSNNVTTFTFNYDGTSSQSRADYCVTPPANLVIEKTAGSAIAQAGDSLQYSIIYGNSGQTDATNASITDTLPAEVSFVDATLNAASITPSISGQNYSFTVGTVAGGVSGNLLINVTVNDPLSANTLSLDNSVSIESDQTQPVSDNAITAIQGAGAAGSPQLVIRKDADNTSVRPGETLTYSIVLLNAGDGDSSNITLTDLLPAAPLGYIANSTRQDGVVVNPDPVSGGNLSLDIGALTPGQTTEITYQMSVGASTGMIDLLNSAQATDGLSSDGPVSVTVAVNANPDLEIIKTATPNTGLEPGDTVAWSLTVTNNGTGTAINARIEDAIPPQMKFIAITQGNGAFDPVNNRVIFTQGEMISGATSTLSFTTVINSTLPDGITALNNTATVTADNNREKSASNTAMATASPALVLNKSGPAQVAYPAALLNADASNATTVVVDHVTYLEMGGYVRIGTTIARITAMTGNTLTLDTAVTALTGDVIERDVNYTLAWQNTGNALASSAIVADTLPSNTLFVAASHGGSEAGGIVTWDLGDLAPGDSGMLSLTLIPVANGSILNSAEFTSGLLAASDSSTTQVGGLQLDKSTSTAVSVAGGHAIYRLRSKNTLAATLNNIVITDSMPPGFSYSNTDFITIDGVTTVPTSAPSLGDTVLTWNFAALPGGSIVEIQFSANIDINAGAATYQNGYIVQADGMPDTLFDPLLTTAEDVTLLGPSTGLVEGFIYQDINENGLYEVGTDTPFPGVQLNITDSTATLYIAHADAFGFFRQVVASGTASVDVADETLPAMPGLQLTTGATDATSVEVPNQGIATDDTGYTDSLLTGTVSGHLFEDNDGNGVQGAGEANLSGIEITITPASDAPFTVTTDLNGDYDAAVVPGSTTLNVADPAGYSLSTANDPQTVQVIAGNHVASAAVGYQPPLTGDLTGHVFNDSNNNGLQDAGEANFVNVSVVVTTSHAATISTNTDANGDYYLAVPPGPTTVNPVDPLGYTLTTGNDPQNVSVPVSGTAIASPIGYQSDVLGLSSGTLGGFVFEDANGDAAYDPGELPLAGVLIQITVSTGAQLHILTDLNGLFSVPVPTGSTLIVYSTPAGYQLTTANDTQILTVIAGQASNASDAGYSAISAAPVQVEPVPLDSKPLFIILILGVLLVVHRSRKRGLYP